GEYSDSWLLAVAAGFLFAALMGLLLQIGVFRYMHGEDLRQTMATIALSIIAADVALWIWGGQIYQFDAPRWIIGSTALPIVGKACWGGARERRALAPGHDFHGAQP